MAPGFYELLGVDARAGADEVRAAYERQLASLVRRLRAANRQSADVSVLEAQERALKEAMEVLSDPGRRRRYDAYRGAIDEGLPTDAESLWEVARGAFVDPAAAAALETVRALTDLPLGDPLPGRDGGAVRFAAEPEPAVPAPPRPAAPLVAPAPPAPVAAVAMPPVEEVPRPRLAVVSDDVLFADDDALDLYPDDEDPDSEVGVSGRGPLAGWFEASPPRVAPAPAVSAIRAGPKVVIAPAAPPPPVPRDPVSALAERYGFDGRFLRGVRELRGLSLEEMARTTRISQRYLEAIEDNGYDRLPAGTFVRGYVKQMAHLLDLDEAEVSEGFMALFAHHRG